jgi:hypothetical protein
LDPAEFKIILQLFTSSNTWVTFFTASVRLAAINTRNSGWDVVSRWEGEDSVSDGEYDIDGVIKMPA